MSQPTEPAAEGSTSAPQVPAQVQARAEVTPPTVGDEGIQVYNPVSRVEPEPEPPTSVDEGFFEPTLSDVRSHAASIAARNKRLNEAPLLTAKHRDAERAERERAKKEKWPNATIRIKFSDGTIVQHVFPSNSPIQPVYAFVRSALREDVREKGFILWQPPQTKYPEHPIPAPIAKKGAQFGKTPIIPPANYGPVRGSTLQGLQGGTGGNESLGDLGLVPQSVLMVKFDEEEMNASSYPAPIREELRAHAQPLPPSVPPSSNSPNAPASGSSTAAKPGAAPGTATGEKKIPKWLQKGLLKKKT